MTNQDNKDNRAADTPEWIVCTLFEGDYHFGLAALINSLVSNGFQGCIAVGYRGSLPPWTNQLTFLGSNGDYTVCPGVRLTFILLDTPLHFANFKPAFMQHLLHDHPACKCIWYFDPDIVIRCSWSFYVRWVQHGIALCEDVNGTLPENHPLRCNWIELASASGLENPAPLREYYNSGFIGVPASCTGFLEIWQAAMRIAESEGFNPCTFTIESWTRSDPFFRGDQDALNIAAMYSRYPLTTIGPEGMDFAPGGFTMFHAVASPKPWRKNMLLSALGGFPPSASDKAFLAHSSSPIRSYSTIQLIVRRLSCNVGALMGRFYHRF